jgi:hypothetical protein
MERLRIDASHSLTALPFRCPACKSVERMVIVWPFWHCPNCQARLVPADLPVSNSTPQKVSGPLFRRDLN